MKNSHSVVGAWAWEILSVLGSTLCLAALVGILFAYDGKPIFTWHGVTLNSIVSVLSTASKAALLFAVGELVSQWKWILFTDRARPLIDFERIDSASRGLLGSLQLMWQCKNAWILRLGALVILLDVAVDPFSQQLVQLRPNLVYYEDRETVLSSAGRYSKGSWFRQQLARLDPSEMDPNTTEVTADADFSMQSAILFGLDQPLKNVIQQGAFNCPTGNCTWPVYESLAICNTCVDISDKLERQTTNIGLYAYLEDDNGAAAVKYGGNTAFRLPNGLFIENDNGWVYNEDINEGANDDIFGAVMMTTFGTGNSSKTVSMQDIDTLIWAMSMIRATEDPNNSSAAWPDLPHAAMECALYYCVNSYSTVVKDGLLQDDVTQVRDALRSADSWEPETLSGPLREEVRQSIEFSDYWSAIKRTDLSLVSPGNNNTQYNISQPAVNGVGSYFRSTFATDLHQFVMPDDNTTEWQLNGFYMTTGQVQYSPSTMQVLFSTEDLNETFTSLATSMSNALRDGSDASFNGASRELVGEKGVLTTFYEIQWPWISLHCASLLLGVTFFVLTLVRNRSAPAWKSSSLAVMARGHQVQDVVHGVEYVKQMEGRAKTMRVTLIEKPMKDDQVQYDPLQTPYGELWPNDSGADVGSSPAQERLWRARLLPFNTEIHAANFELPSPEQLTRIFKLMCCEDMAAPRKPYDPAEAIEPHVLAKLDAEFVTRWTELMNSIPDPTHEVTIEEIRADPRVLAPPCALDTKGRPRTAENEVTSEDGAKIPVRVYYPDESKHGPGPYPVHLNFHGGGFVLGNLSTESTLCLSMCEGAGIVVVDVNYRHCPETVWGKCFQDGWAALKWVQEEAGTLNARADSISLGGISAGGHISIVLQHLARDAGIPLKLVMATVPPSVDGLFYKYYTDSPYPSFHEFYRGPILAFARIKWFGNLAVSEDKKEDLKKMWPEWWFAPLRAPDFKGLCPTLVRTAECDPLRDEGEAYAMKLVTGGNKVSMKRYLGAPHTFMYMDFMKQKQQYDLDSIDALKEAHGIK